MLLTEVKSTKFTKNDTEMIEGIIKKANEQKSKYQPKVKLSNIMRESTLKEVKRIEKELKNG